MGKNSSKRRNVSPKKVVMYYYDEEREYLYNKPYREPGAKLVTHEELVKATKDEAKTVILIEGGEK